MSYCVSLKDRATGAVATTALPLDIDCGNICLNPGTNRSLSVSITYNYSEVLKKAFGARGLHLLCGVGGYISIPILASAIAGLGDDCDSDYWKETEGNVKLVLLKLLQMAAVAPGAVWEVN